MKNRRRSATVGFLSFSFSFLHLCLSQLFLPFLTTPLFWYTSVDLGDLFLSPVVRVDSMSASTMFEERRKKEHCSSLISFSFQSMINANNSNLKGNHGDFRM